MLIIDPICPTPYSPETMGSRTMGGTEATVIRLLEAMPEAIVMQHNRTEIDPNHVRYRPVEPSALSNQGPVVVMRRPADALQFRGLGWQGPLFLWLHDLTDLPLSLAMPLLAEAEITLIAVSRWHLKHVMDHARAVMGPGAPMPKTIVIANPLAAGLTPGPAERDPDRLIYISTPIKGLADVIGHFIALRKRHPKLELTIANPGGVPVEGVAGLRVLGDLLHAQAMEEVSQAFCMFYPNMSYPETFGIVYAEANALGTPVLAHDFGSAREVLGDDRQIVNAYDSRQVIARYEAWREGDRPVVAPRPEFALSRVVEAWRRLVSGPSTV